MTEKQILRYLDLVDRRLFIITHSGLDWKPEYGPELAEIDRELAELKVLRDQEHARREARTAEPAKVPTMITIAQASTETGLSYDCLRKLCLQGRLVHVRAGRKFLINKEKLADYLNMVGAGA